MEKHFEGSMMPINQDGFPMTNLESILKRPGAFAY
jgi:hypothetical protein